MDESVNGTNYVYGDDWQVVSLDKRIPAGTEVKVTSVNGTKLEVQTKEGNTRKPTTFYADMGT